jgi:hypothetical protein
VGGDVAGGAVSDWLFAERDRRLRALARDNPYRHPPSKRTWQDWDEIRRQTEYDPLTHDEAQLLLKCIRLAPNIATLEALMSGRQVPTSQLDPRWAKAYGIV